MTVKECYAAMNADFDGVMSRLLAETRVAKFAVRFPEDPSFASLCDSFAAGDYETAFRAAHTLKGTSANLGFTELYQKASDVTEELRNGNPSAETADKLKLCKAAYEEVCSALKDYIANRTD